MKLEQININKIVSNKEQPRSEFDKEKIEELGNSIKKNGQTTPITLERINGKYMLISGERRVRACKLKGIKTVLSIIKEYKTTGDKAVESLIENTFRQDLNPFEKAKYLIKIKKMEKLKTDAALGNRVGMSTNAIYLSLQYLKLDKRIVDKVAIGDINPSTARTLADLERNDQRKMATKAQKMTFQETEKAVSIIKTGTKEVKEALMKNEISVDEADDIKDLDEKKQKFIIGGLKQMKKTIKDIPKSLKDSNMDNDSKKTALEVINKLQAELSNTTSKMYKMSHILDGFYEEKVFDAIPKQYKETILQIIKELEKAGAELTKSIIKIRGYLK